MGMWNPFRSANPIWVVLGKACADNANSLYPVGEKHAFLAMVRSEEQSVNVRVSGLLAVNGWTNFAIERFKLLNDPFISDDPTMIKCYAAASRKDGGVIIYSDPEP